MTDIKCYDVTRQAGEVSRRSRQVLSEGKLPPCTKKTVSFGEQLLPSMLFTISDIYNFKAITIDRSQGEFEVDSEISLHGVFLNCKLHLLM